MVVVQGRGEMFGLGFFVPFFFFFGSYAPLAGAGQNHQFPITVCFTGTDVRLLLFSGDS